MTAASSIFCGTRSAQVPHTHSISTKLAAKEEDDCSALQFLCDTFSSGASHSQHLHKVGGEHASLAVQLSPLPVGPFRYHGTQDYLVPNLEKRTQLIFVVGS